MKPRPGDEWMLRFPCPGACGCGFPARARLLYEYHTGFMVRCVSCGRVWPIWSPAFALDRRMVQGAIDARRSDARA